MKTQLLSALLLALPWLAIAAEPKSPNEITGTWIAVGDPLTDGWHSMTCMGWSSRMRDASQAFRGSFLPDSVVSAVWRC